jgi:hypothetical protein
VAFDEHIARAHGAQAIERQQRIPEVVEHAEEQHHVERAVALRRQRVDASLLVRHTAAEQLARDREPLAVDGRHVERQHLAGPAALGFEAEESVPGADVEHSQARQVVGQPAAPREVAQVLERSPPGRDDPGRHLDRVKPLALTHALTDVCLHRRLLAAPSSSVAPGMLAQAAPSAP